MLPELCATLAARLAAEPDVRRWVIAYSGGLDSSLLLELCARLALPQPLLAVYVDHQLQAVSADWGEHCRQHCRRLNIPLTVVKVSPESSSEAAARSARYAAFETLLGKGDCLLLAQHADDQAETLLLRLLRGAGVAGLSGMPERRGLGRGTLLRPLLDQSRARLEIAAAEQGLVPIIDPTNAQDHYARNWLRLHVLPLLKGRWPAVLQRCLDTTELMHDADVLLRERAEEDWAQCRLGESGLDIERLRALGPERQRNLLHFWLHRLAGQRLSRQRLQNLLDSMLSERADAEPVECLKGQQLRRYRQGLYLLPDPVPTIEPDTRVWLRAGQALNVPHGRLGWQRAARGLPDGLELQLAYRQGGERLRPMGRGGSVTLKQLLQEAGVPPWLRPIHPVLWSDGQIVAVPGLCLCDPHWVENGWLPQWDAFGLS
ncbi:tRNA lysidine(34) synthetase TilS [Marinobacterium marinum]|uniref:tRNA(Ile)-lysidine synthase n=1 Tax=Marinobacterium marinum TaxID=2756129 RepID=A0A7W2ABC1_9GAMM|nr:tRNA lysidine(34) synthetase TilS [Marinobacterium marinum]MBA4502796.1 tRNA lysidine(34) synthetase TilS [Marinobacterium marinum]